MILRCPGGRNDKWRGRRGGFSSEYLSFSHHWQEISSLGRKFSNALPSRAAKQILLPIWCWEAVYGPNVNSSSPAKPISITKLKFIIITKVNIDHQKRYLTYNHFYPGDDTRAWDQASSGERLQPDDPVLRSVFRIGCCLVEGNCHRAHKGRVILILQKFEILDFAWCQIVLICSLISELFLFFF